MKPFPSPEERLVASALLLLSVSAAPPPSPSPPLLGREVKQLSLSFTSMSSGKTGSRSCTSSLTSDGSSSKAPIRSLKQLKAMVAARSYNAMNLKVTRKKRTQVVRWTSSDGGGFPKKADSVSGSVSTEHDSCVSSASFASSAAARGICFMKTDRANQTTALINKRKKVQSVYSARLKRRAEAIMMLLSGGHFSEVSIRQVFGDSPDTSKALRMLLRKEDIKRSGTGGRCDPYIYMVA